MAEKPTRGRPNKIWLLPETIRDALNAMLRDRANSQAAILAAFFKIVVAQSCFKQPLSAPARVSRAAPDLASRHR